MNVLGDTKVGDELLLYNFGKYSVAIVDRVTTTRVMIGNRTFIRKCGRLYGAEYNRYRTSAAPMTDNARELLAKQQAEDAIRERFHKARVAIHAFKVTSANIEQVEAFLLHALNRPGETIEQAAMRAGELDADEKAQALR